LRNMSALRQLAGSKENLKAAKEFDPSGI